MVSLAQPAQVDDPAHSRLPRGPGERLGTPAVLLGVVARGGHGMNEVVGGVHTAEREAQRGGVQDVTRHDFGAGRDSGAEVLRPPGHAPKRPLSGLERAPEPAADVAAGSGEENEPGAHAGAPSPGRRRRIRIFNQPSRCCTQPSGNDWCGATPPRRRHFDAGSIA